ncbi:DUF6876 family protein [Gloeocapsa sp. BRSZ]
MKSETEHKAALSLKTELQHFSGTVAYHRFSQLWPQGFQTTDGVAFLAKRAGAYWLLDAIAFVQREAVIAGNEALQDFQLWELKVRENRSAELVCSRDSDQPVWKQEIPFTDFPLDEITLYVANNVLMLTSEW